MAANTPRTYAVNRRIYIGEEKREAEFYLENSIGEALQGKWTVIDGEDDAFQITRHQAGWNTQEAQEWIDGMTREADYRCIWSEQPTIG